MKLLKLLTPLFVGSLTMVNLVGCNDNKNPEPEPNVVEQFISNRTFSLMGMAENKIHAGEYGFCWGTAWIVDDSTPDNNNDYKYYLATNMHVSHGNDYFVQHHESYKEVEYKYADVSLTKRSDKILDSWKDYISFKSCVRQDETKFEFDSPEKETYYVPCIDMMVYSVDFGNPSGTIKTKLDNLNQYSKDKGYINKFVNPKDSQILKKRKHIGGYPYKENKSGSVFGGRWEFQTLESSELNVVDKEGVTWEEDIFKYPGHTIGQPKVNRDGDSLDAHWELIGEDPANSEEYYYDDISAQYKCKTAKEIDWMDAGSSGSMLVTEDCEVCGIYWGGYGGETDDEYYPYFSLFKADQDFISQWLRTK